MVENRVRCKQTDMTMTIDRRECLCETAAAAPQLQRPVLLYSSSCRFCRWAARVVATLDRGEQLALLPLTHEGAGRLLVRVPEDRRAESWWIVRRDGVAVAGKSGGGIVLLTALRLTRPLGHLVAAIGLSAVVDALDRFLARYRGRLSPFVPDGPAPQRFP
jgi:predicted DCC family thiol-disulfide oxidoreductase YuxK